MFRASFTTLHFWESRDYDRAITNYLKIKPEPSEAMVAGKLIHRQFELEVNRTKRMPQVFGSRKLINPQTELKIEIMLRDWLQLVGVIDCYDFPVIFDWKTGKSTSDVYANGMQAKVYHLLKREARRFEIHHLNQHTGETDCAIGHLTQRSEKEAEDWVIKNSTEMYQYMKQKGFL